MTIKSRLLPKNLVHSRGFLRRTWLRLEQESRVKDAEIERLQKRLAQVEDQRDSLKSELKKEKEKNDSILQDTLKLLQAKK